jgi:hypothetical protein
VVIGVFLDLKRAFETIDRVILLYLMQLEGIEDEELSWFRDYLTGKNKRQNLANQHHRSSLMSWVLLKALVWAHNYSYSI